MTLMLMQWAGGLLYFLNKVFLSFSETARKRDQVALTRQWRIASWVVYLAGLPPWVFILASKHDWIAASVEASGAPAMLLGLVTSLRGTTKNTPRWLDRLALFCIPFGFAYSVYDFGGLNTLTQLLEIALVAGFLVGTYQLAKEKYQGYLWYVIMHVAAGWLMYEQGFFWLCLQQVASLGFIVSAYITARRG